MKVQVTRKIRRNKKLSRNLLIGLIPIAGLSAMAFADETYIGATTPGTWNNINNWSGTAVPTPADSVFMTGNLSYTLPVNIGLDNAFTIQTLNYSTGTTVNLQADTSGNGTKVLTLNGNGSALINVTGNTSLTLSSYSAALNPGNATLTLALGGSGTFNVDGGSTLDIQGTVTGVGQSIEKTGNGTVIFRGANSNFNQGFKLTAGTVLVGTSTALGNSTSNPITLAGGAIGGIGTNVTFNGNLSVTGDVQINVGTGTGAVSFAGNASSTGNRVLTFVGTTSTFSAFPFVLGGNLTANGNGGASFTGGLALNSGDRTVTGNLTSIALILGNTTNSSVTGTGNFTFAANSAAAGTITGTINNVGTFTNAGTGAGTVTVAGGIGTNVTRVTQASNTSALTISGNVTLGADLVVAANGTTALTTVSGNSTGGFNLTYQANSTGNITVSGQSKITGNLTLQTNSTGVISVTGNVTSTNVVTNSGSGAGNVTISAVIQSGNVVQANGNDSMNLTGANTYTGATSVQAGTLQVGNASTFTNTSGFFLSSGGRLDVNVIDQSLAKLASPTGSGVVAGSVLKLSKTQGNATTGPGTVAGTVELGVTSANPGYTLNFSNGGALKNALTSSVIYIAPLTFAGNATIDSTLGSLTVGNSTAGGLSASTSGLKVITLATGSNTLSLLGTISPGFGDIALFKTGNGTLVLGAGSGNSPNSFSGGVTVGEGTLQVASGFVAGLNSVGNGGIVLGDGNSSHNASLTNGSINSNLSSNITTAAGSGNLTLFVFSSSAPAYSGNITLNGNLTIGMNSAGFGSSFSGNFTLNGNQLNFNESAGASSPTVTGLVSGTGTINVFRTGTASGGQVIFSANNTGLSATINVFGNQTLGTGGNFAGANVTTPLGNGTIFVADGSGIFFGSSSTTGSVDYGNGKIVALPGATATLTFGLSSGRTHKIGDIDLGNSTAGAANLAVTFGTGGNMLGASGAITLFGNSTINVTPNANLNASTFNIVGGVSGNYSLTKTGSGNLTFGGGIGVGTFYTLSPAYSGVASTYTGDTVITQGVVRIGMDNALPTATTTYIASGASLDMGYNNVNYDLSIGGLQDYSGAGGTVNGINYNLAGSSKALSFTGNGTYAFSGVISDKPATGNFTAVTGKLSVVQSGIGTQTLTGTNTYTGPTTVSAGKLIVGVSGVGSIASDVQVNAGTFGGSGSTTGSVTVGDGSGTADAIMSPGNSPGTFTAGGALTFNSDGVYNYELNTTATAASDKIIANGVTITGNATFSFNASGDDSGVGNGSTFLVIDNTSGSAITGVFSNLANGGTFTFGGFDYTANYAGGLDGYDLVFTASTVGVPEPTSLAIFGLGGLAALSRRRRRRVAAKTV